MPSQTFVDIAVNLRYNCGEVIIVAANTTYNIRIDKRVRQEADMLFKSMGMSLSTAINLFCKHNPRQMVRKSHF